MAAVLAVAVVVSAPAAARDRAPLPAPRLLTHPAAETNQTAARFTFRRVRRASYSCRIDRRPFRACGSPVRFAGLAEGAHAFELRARRASGRRSRVRRFTWRVDVTAPTPVLLRAPRSPTAAADAEFAFQVPEGAPAECALDGGGFEVCTGSRGYGGLGEGAHEFAVRARDRAGNVGMARHRWVVDRTPPPVPRFAAAPRDPSNDRSPAFAFEADGAAEYLCSLDGGAFGTCSASHVIAGVGEGSHSLSVRARDAAGNEGGAATHAWRADFTPPPAPVIAAAPPRVSYVHSPLFAFTHAGEGTLRCRLDTGDFAPCSSPLRYPAVMPGARTFVVEAVDEAGNASSDAHSWIARARDDGAYAGPGPAEANAFAAWRGRGFRYALDYIGNDSWSQLEGGGATHIASWGDSGYRLVLSTPLLPASGATLAVGATGAYNEHFRKLGTFLVANGLADTVIRLGWEFNGDWFVWSAKNQPTAFKDFWRQVVGTMRAVPGARFEFDWCPNSGFTGMAAEDGYPGDAYVDYVGLSTFDAVWLGADRENPASRWQTLRTQPNGLDWQREFARVHGKPMTYPEWGLWQFAVPNWLGGTDGKDDPHYVARMREWMDVNEVAYALYFDFDSPDGYHAVSTGRFPQAAAEYRRRFGG